jgi:protein-S-isoprenylcysteine O-methyltransferase Ste14
MATPFAVADTIFAWATVELRVPVATPLASVVPLGWVSVLPLPVAASTTVAPLIGLPLASCTATVIVALSLPAVSELGDAATVDSVAEGEPTVTVTVAPWVTAVPLIVADTVFASGTMELNVPVATPLALVGPAG